VVTVLRRGHPGSDQHPRRRFNLDGFAFVLLAVFASVALHPWLGPLFSAPAVQTWSTMFVSMLLQAMPFLVMGVVFSGGVAAFVSAERLARLFPKNRVGSVGAASCAGVLLPGCECGSVPIAGRLVAGGMVPAAALAFMVAAPAINPVVLVSTAVAFPGRPEMVLGRFLASFLLAVVMGLIWLRRDEGALVEWAKSRTAPGETRAEVFATTVRHDFLQAGGFLVFGAAAAAALQTLVPRSFLAGVGGTGVAAMITMAVLAVILSICSEADAFVAASFTQVPAAAQLCFMVVGPAVDLKLAAMQTGVFGRRFALRFAPATVVVAVALSAVVGWWLL
jgi:uncharacterized protein